MQHVTSMIVSLVVIILTVLGILLFLAMQGDIWAVSILVATWSIFCVFIGWGMSVYQQAKTTAKEQQNFIANAKENVSLLGAMQSVQNKQSSMLMSQLATAARLPQPAALADPANALNFEDAIFEELE